MKEAQLATALITTDRAIHEAHRRLELGLEAPELLEVLDDLATALTIVPIAALKPLLASCEIALRDASACRNDLACGDFAGIGIATWSMPHLMRRLAEAAADRGRLSIDRFEG